MLLHPYDIWNTDIPTPKGLQPLLDKIFVHRNKSWAVLSTVRFSSDSPPIFLYTESRDESNYATYFAYYAGGGSLGGISTISARHLVSLNSKYVDTAVRGEVLDAFCRIEFVIDVFCCIQYGVFSDQITYEELKKQFDNTAAFTGDLSSLDRKVTKLYKAKAITKKTKDLLLKAKEIRNALAHQYLPKGTFGVTKEDLHRYGSTTKAIEIIFDGAWLYLLKDFSGRQIEEAKWLANKIKTKEHNT